MKQFFDILCTNMPLMKLFIGSSFEYARVLINNFEYARTACSSHQCNFEDDEQANYFTTINHLTKST